MRLLAACIILTFNAVSAGAECLPITVGFTVDEDDPQACFADLPMGTQITLHVYAEIGAPLDPLMQINLQTSNWVTEYGINPIEIWNTPTYSGNLAAGVILVFSPPLEVIPGQRLDLGQVLIFNPAILLPPDLRTELGGEIRDWSEQCFGEQPGYFTFNCSADCICHPANMPPNALMMRAFDPPPLATVPGSFPFSFEVRSWRCDGWQPVDYAGELRVEGELIATFAGAGTELEWFQLDTGALPPGGLMDVDLIVTGPDLARTAHLIYTVGEPTGVPSSSTVIETGISAVKSRY